MEFNAVLSGRYSCRKYADTPVEREKLMACAEAGRLAPSACNSQRWVFVLVDEEEQKKRIADALYDDEVYVNTFAHRIPAFIVMVGHPARNPNEKQQKLLSHADFSQIDIGIAAENICLAATDMGLGTVMMGWFREEQIQEAIGVPADLPIRLVIGVGYPEQPPINRTPRLDAGEIIRINHYNNRSEGR
ncbi:nitroreductase family protein [Ruminococcaceae bacterium OttesenSCG-928-L11]|nr:nitroreductase family protein [Ruminococcaceae bacterium OttesenSCG-928-L11]